MHFGSLFVVLLAVWVLLSGQFTALHLGAGALFSLLITYIAIRKGITDPKGMPVNVLGTIVTYWPWLFYKIVMANVDVAYRVWHPRLPISPRFVNVPYTTKTDLGSVLYANSITLTPGTVTVAVDKRELLVHALTEQGAQELLAGEMHDRVKALERRP